MQYGFPDGGLAIWWHEDLIGIVSEQPCNVVGLRRGCSFSRGWIHDAVRSGDMQHNKPTAETDETLNANCANALCESRGPEDQSQQEYENEGEGLCVKTDSYHLQARLIDKLVLIRRRQKRPSEVRGVRADDPYHA